MFDRMVIQGLKLPVIGPAESVLSHPLYAMILELIHLPGYPINHLPLTPFKRGGSTVGHSGTPSPPAYIGDEALNSD